MQCDCLIILVGVDWCASCKAMKTWFLDLDLPGVTLRYMDIEELPDENISSLPAILFRENGETKQVIFGALGKADLLSKARSFFWRRGMRKPMRQVVGGACVIVTILNIVLNWLFYIRGTPPTLMNTIWITIIGFVIYITLDYIFDYLKVERMNDTSKQCLFCEKINRNCFSIIRSNINAAASALEIVNGIAELKSESFRLHGENKLLKEEINQLKKKLESK